MQRGKSYDVLKTLLQQGNALSSIAQGSGTRFRSVDFDTEGMKVLRAFFLRKCFLVD